MPESLAAWGVYPDAPDLGRTREGLVRYEPRFPLWSNGSTKLRDLALPPGAEPPDPEALDAGDLPTGTLFFKTFAFEDAEVPGGLRPVETRVMIRLADGEWDYASYLWNAHGTDALRRDTAEPAPVQIALPDGERFTHLVPSRTQCRACHERTRSVILGYDRLQLGLSSLPAELAAANDLTRAVLGYAIGNCTSCHNTETVDSLFDLGPEAFVRNVVDRETETRGLEGLGVRVVPGDPTASVLLTALAGGDATRGVPAMPPIGAERVDAEAVALVRAWILSLGEAAR